MYLAITGGRAYAYPEIVWATLDEYDKTNLFLVLGDANGVDTQAKSWAERYKVPHKVHRADWETFGKAAGPLRNGEMIKEADALLAFPGGRGTENCTNQAIQKGIPVRRVT